MGFGLLEAYLSSLLPPRVTTIRAVLVALLVGEFCGGGIFADLAVMHPVCAACGGAADRRSLAAKKGVASIQ